MFWRIHHSEVDRSDLCVHAGPLTLALTFLFLHKVTSDCLHCSPPTHMPHWTAPGEMAGDTPGKERGCLEERQAPVGWEGAIRNPQRYKKRRASPGNRNGERGMQAELYSGEGQGEGRRDTEKRRGRHTQAAKMLGCSGRTHVSLCSQPAPSPEHKSQGSRKRCEEEKQTAHEA